MSNKQSRGLQNHENNKSILRFQLIKKVLLPFDIINGNNCSLLTFRICVDRDFVVKIYELSVIIPNTVNHVNKSFVFFFDILSANWTRI